jgi:hypothetical protein
MYTNKEFSVPAVEAILSVITERATGQKFSKYDTENDPDFSRLAGTVQHLLTAIKAGRSVFFVLQKSPRGGLETGRHWFDLYFVNDEGRAERFWPWSPAGAKICGMSNQDRDRSMHKYIFSSGAIGMDRFLSATQGLAYLLGEAVGAGKHSMAFQFSSSDCL